MLMTNHRLCPQLYLEGYQEYAGIHWLIESRLDLMFVVLYPLGQNFGALWKTQTCLWLLKFPRDLHILAVYQQFSYPQWA